MNCLFEGCESIPSRDYPACSVHAVTMHFPHRHCICRSCEAERATEPSLRLAKRKWTDSQYAEAAKAAGGVLVVKKEAA